MQFIPPREQNICNPAAEYKGFKGLTSLCVSSCCSIQDGFMRSFRTQQTMWATDWLVTRRTTQSPILLQSTLLFHFCPSTLTTHNRPLPPAAAAPPHQKTPSLLLHTPQPSLNTPQCRACPPLPRGWQRILFPRSSTSEYWYDLSTELRWNSPI